MTPYRNLTVYTIASLILICAASAAGQSVGIIDTLRKSIPQSPQDATGSSLPEARVADGLKEALTVGAVNAVGLVSRQDGFWGNPQIRIPLPGSIEKVAPMLRAVGYGEQIDAFELSMNRAAEKAAPVARDMFVGAVEQMTFEDAGKILSGGDNAATDYLREKTGAKLGQAFKPIVRQSMSDVGVTRAYQDLTASAAAVPFAQIVNFDLDQYVTDRSLDGLFWMIGQEEAKIRHDPAARVTGLMQEVFGGR